MYKLDLPNVIWNLIEVGYLMGISSNGGKTDTLQIDVLFPNAF